MFSTEEIFGIDNETYLRRFGLEIQIAELNFDLYLLKKQKEKITDKYRANKVSEKDKYYIDLLDIINNKIKKRNQKLKLRQKMLS
jgi:hypothetical protein